MLACERGSAILSVAAVTLLCAALASGCSASHAPGPAPGSVADGGGGLPCGALLCAAGEVCCPGCTLAEASCAPAGGSCALLPCVPPPPPAWTDCDAALAGGGTGDACEGDWACASADSCCSSGARCDGGRLVLSHRCAPACGACASAADCASTERCCPGSGSIEAQCVSVYALCPGSGGTPPPTRVCGTRGAPPCAGDEFCDFTPNACGRGDVPGTCERRPEACPLIYDPVCGCDEVTYENECAADAAGIDITARGECPPPPMDCRTGGCAAGMDCVPCWGEFACVPDGAIC